MSVHRLGNEAGISGSSKSLFLASIIFFPSIKLPLVILPLARRGFGVTDGYFFVNSNRFQLIGKD